MLGIIVSDVTLSSGVPSGSSAKPKAAEFPGKTTVGASVESDALPRTPYLRSFQPERKQYGDFSLMWTASGLPANGNLTPSSAPQAATQNAHQKDTAKHNADCHGACIMDAQIHHRFAIGVVSANSDYLTQRSRSW